MKEDYVEYRRKIVRKAVAKRRAMAKELGLCTQCVKEPAAHGRTLCYACALRSRKNQMKYYYKMKEKAKNSFEFSGAEI